jgi:hypothetical protein
MTRDEIEQLIKIRTVLIEGHGKLDARGQVTAVAMTKQSVVAEVYESAISRVDKLLSTAGVEFSK